MVREGARRLLAVGLIGYAVWRFAEAVIGRPLEGGGLRAGRGAFLGVGVVGHLARAVVFGRIGFTLLAIVSAVLIAYGLFCSVEARYREV